MPHPRLTALPQGLARILDHWTDERSPLPPLLQRLADREVPWPMAIGIHTALQARYPDVPEAEIRRLLGAIARADAYCRSCLPAGARRYDLEGNPTSLISKGERQHAVAQLAWNREREAKRKAKSASAIVPESPPPPAPPRRPILTLPGKRLAAAASARQPA